MKNLSCGLTVLQKKTLFTEKSVFLGSVYPAKCSQHQYHGLYFACPVPVLTVPEGSTGALTWDPALLPSHSLGGTIRPDGPSAPGLESVYDSSETNQIICFPLECES